MFSNLCDPCLGCSHCCPETLEQKKPKSAKDYARGFKVNISNFGIYTVGVSDWTEIMKLAPTSARRK